MTPLKKVRSFQAAFRVDVADFAKRWNRAYKTGEIPAEMLQDIFIDEDAVSDAFHTLERTAAVLRKLAHVKLPPKRKPA